MKQVALVTVFALAISSISFAAPREFIAKDCNQTGQREDLEDDVSDSVLTQNDFSGGQYLVSALPLTPKADQRYTEMGAAIIVVSKDDTEIQSLFVCNSGKGSNSKSSSLQSNFSLESAISIKDILKKGSAKYDLEGGVYMGDEHVAAKGSYLNAEVESTKEGVASIRIKFAIRITDLTETDDGDETAENLPVHDIVSGEAYISLPMMTLKTK